VGGEIRDPRLVDVGDGRGVDERRERGCSFSRVPGVQSRILRAPGARYVAERVELGRGQPAGKDAGHLLAGDRQLGTETVGGEAVHQPRGMRAFDVDVEDVGARHIGEGRHRR